MTRLRLSFYAGMALIPAMAALAAAPAVVDQTRRAFSVKSLQIHRGDSVRFNNVDDFIHHLYINSPAFKFSSQEQPPGQAVNITFPANGTFEVRCEIHPKMAMTVLVE